MPWLLRRLAVASELATAAPKVCFILARASIKQLAVDPVPTPIIDSQLR